MRGLGGYFIRRKLDKSGQKDYLYRAILHSVSMAALGSSPDALWPIST